MSTINSTISDSDIKTCLRVLESIAFEDLPHGQSKEIIEAARTLVARSKRELKKQNFQRRIDLERMAGPAISKHVGAEDERYTTSRIVSSDPSPETKHYSKGKCCYVCKKTFTQRHHFYGELCTECGDLNFEKRHQTVQLENKNAIVTGGRIKIGFEVALKLLRAGAKVLVTTRFPVDASKRFAEAKDYSEWNDRLQIYAIDLRNSPAVTEFANYVKTTMQCVDLLINNAAQTISRPPAFYQHLIEDERNAVRLPKQIVASAFAAQLESKQMMISEIQQYFPVGLLDLDRQQIDLRTDNSWSIGIDEVEPREMVEVVLVNTVAPFLLVSKLIPQMGQPSFIINVSAREGQFQSSWKRPHHPHTNMAKAALNMMTRTCADSLAERKIYMNSVDTGWITNEFPFRKVESMNESGWSRPLDEIDGAARILDPIFSATTNGDVPFGQYFKDYMVAQW